MFQSPLKNQNAKTFSIQSQSSFFLLLPVLPPAFPSSSPTYCFNLIVIFPLFFRFCILIICFADIFILILKEKFRKPNTKKEAHYIVKKVMSSEMLEYYHN
jgi:hypothetical protein